MFSQPVEIIYRDGTTETVVLDQWSIGEWGVYCQSKGWKFDPKDPGLMAVQMLRFQAWAEKHRGDTKTRPGFDVWNSTVAEVADPVGPEPVDPTRPGTSDE